MRKSQSFIIQGMNRDMSASKLDPKYAYEIKNMRIFPTTENTLMSMVNEKGNKKAVLDIKYYIGEKDEEGNPIYFHSTQIEGVPIGQAALNDTLVLFCCGQEYEETDEDGNPILDEEGKPIIKRYDDIIYSLELTNDGSSDFTGLILYRGDLNFHIENPIETLVYYENLELQKVYWTDGLNQPRVINIAADDDTRFAWDNTQFDFVREMDLQENVSIIKDESIGGLFAPGAIQYVFTYFDKYMQETNPFYISPLFYVSYVDRGGSPEDSISNSFTINITNIDNRFDYVRIYSILRTSINAVPECKKVVDLLPIQNNDGAFSIFYVDTGTTGESIDPTELLYVGGQSVTFNTMTQKDNTLFLGDILLNQPTLKELKIKDSLKDCCDVKFEAAKPLEFEEPTGIYPYKIQLSENSEKIKTFKYLEWYRFGLTFQYKTGAWSEVVWIGDKQNNIHIDTTFYSSSAPNLIYAYIEKDLTLDTEFKEIITKLVARGYKRVKPVIVYPSIIDRECVCQGILCPTIYNIEDRSSNSPFSQSSWFARPNAPFDVEDVNSYSTSGGTEGLFTKMDFRAFNTPGIAVTVPSYGADANSYKYSRAGVMAYQSVSTFVQATIDDEQSAWFRIHPIPSRLNWSEFRHGYSIPKNSELNAEIQCIEDATSSYENDCQQEKYKNSYYIDQSIVTLHSPDIEFEDQIQNLDSYNLKLRIIGIVPITAVATDLDVQTSTPPLNYLKNANEDKDKEEYYEEIAPGFVYTSTNVQNGFCNDPSIEEQHDQGDDSFWGTSHFGWKGLLSSGWWQDAIYRSKSTGKTPTTFVVYPWHRSGSLNNCPSVDSDGYRSALLQAKKMSNLRFSYKTQYLDKDLIWEPDGGISQVTIFNSDEIILTKLAKQEHSNLDTIHYYGNVDKLLVFPTNLYDYKGYSIINEYDTRYVAIGEDSVYDDCYYGTDPVRIKYKSTPHAVLALNYNNEGNQVILPTISDWNRMDVEDPIIPTPINGLNGKSCYDGISDKPIISQSSMELPDEFREFKQIGGIQYGWLWLGELYRDNVSNRFGGDTEEALENSTWEACGEAIPLIDKDGNVVNTIRIEWTEGDTYYQRYDHIKTYPFTLEDENSVTEIVSFMCETRVNLDGRYDRNRGQTSNLAITPENFNQVNSVYSQENNFFTYHTLNENLINLDNFHNSLTWTKTKVAGDLVDTWTNITLASTLDLDGDKGSVRALERFNNQILAFQDTGISQIKYNENVQLASTEGVPVELANSGKVDGKDYLTNQLGCTNKWSIRETPNGLYFIDNITKGIYIFNGQFTNLTDNGGFSTWITNELQNTTDWNSVDFGDFITYYDKINNDVAFINKGTCLAFSEVLGGFSSFYDYEDTPYMVNVKDKFISIRKDNTDDNDNTYYLWLQNEGDYNIFFGEYKPFWLTIIANDGMVTDKTFDNIEFRADTFDKDGDYICDETFDYLEAKNEYQYGNVPLWDSKGHPAWIKKKFKIWRAIIPRDKESRRDRIRSPWAYITLSKKSQDKHKTILHDMQIIYYDNTPIGLQTQQSQE